MLHEDGNRWFLMHIVQIIHPGSQKLYAIPITIIINNEELVSFLKYFPNIEFPNFTLSLISTNI